MLRKILLSFLLVITGLNAQSALFLLIPPIPSFNGMGEIGVGLPSEDIGATYYNPANGFINNSGLSLSGFTMKSEWLPGLVHDMYLQHKQYGLSYYLPHTPFQFHLHQHETFLDAGKQQYTDANGMSLGTFKTWFRARSMTFGARYIGKIWEIPAKISYGLSRKYITQHLTDEIQNGEIVGSADDVVYDRGLLVAIPFENAWANLLHFNVIPSFGCSRMNIGNSVVFNDPAQADPMPTVARVGIGIIVRVSLKDKLNLFKYSGSRAAMDPLHVPRTSHEQPIEYQWGFGDIELIKHLLKSESSGQVDVSRGYELNFLDCYSIRAGRRIDLDGRIDLYESGYGYNSKGVLDIVYFLTGVQLVQGLNHHIQFSYDYAEWTTHSNHHPLEETEFENWRITVSDILSIPKTLFGE